MARSPRINVPGLTYHVTNRGVKKLELFHDDEDRQRFLRLLLITQIQFPFVLQAYSLMTNHFHLLIKTVSSSLSQFMQCFTSRYAFWFNRKYGHVGHAFQSRFHSIPVQTDAYLAQVSRYIDLNAPRAGMVVKPEEFPWCGYRSIIQRKRDPIADPTEILLLFNENLDRAQTLYERFVLEDMTRPAPVTHEKLLRMRSWGALPDMSAVLNPAIVSIGKSYR